MKIGDYVRTYNCSYECILEVVDIDHSFYRVKAVRALCTREDRDCIWFGGHIYISGHLIQEIDQFNAFAEVVRFNAGIKA